MTQQINKGNRTHKSDVFSDYFAEDSRRLVQLTNALLGTVFPADTEVELVTLQSILNGVFKNDLGFIISSYFMILTEHQSSLNPNMPLRELLYLAEEYTQYVATYNLSLFSQKQLTLPTPRLFVLYNGLEDAPQEEILPLSKAFTFQKETADVEVYVHFINIKPDAKHPVLKNCKALYDYSHFIDRIQKNTAAQKMPLEQAIEEALEYCIQQDIMADYLQKKRAEVTHVLYEQYSIEKERSMYREELNEAMFQLQEIKFELDAKKSELDAISFELDTKNSELDAKNSELDAKNSELDAKNSELDAKNSEL
ncbi:MAG: coiled-coil domain-containing protein, partial [Lachnospiraceae bacterium]